MSLDLDKFDKERDEAFRAIGRFVVAFSQLNRSMRWLIAEFLGPNNEVFTYASITLGELHAAQLAHAFFGLCRKAARYTEAEAEIAGQLQREIEEEIIPARNDIAHGDWQIGALDIASTATLPPTLTRIIPHRKVSPIKIIELDVAGLDRMTDRLRAVALMTDEFGRLALGLPVLRGSAVSQGELRVQDVFAIPGSKKSRTTPAVASGSQPNRRAKVTRTGRSAAEVLAPSYIEPEAR